MLVAGASGLVGYAAVKHFHEHPDWDVVGVSRRVPEGLGDAELISVDLQDRERCQDVFGRMGDVTHLVFAALYEWPGLVQGWFEQEQMQTNLAMLDNLFDPLEGAAGGLEHVSLLQGTKAYGIHIEPFPAPARERWPRHDHENFYFLQQDYLRDRQIGKDWHWTVWRPQLILGESLGSAMNCIAAIGAWAAVEKEAGRPLCYPGGPPCVVEAIDTEIHAQAFEWAAQTPAARNEIFNITNGDIFLWRNVWPAIAEALGMEVGPERPLSLVETMPAREAEWQAVHTKYELTGPRSLDAFVGQSFVVADFIMGVGSGQVSPPPMVVSTIKLRQAGFHEFMDTEDCFQKWFKRFQDRGWLPPV